MKRDSEKKLKLVFVHGNSGGGYHFSKATDLLKEYQVLSYIIPGHEGIEILPQFDLPLLAKDFLGFLDGHISSEDNTILLGHSLGGNIIYHAIPHLLNCPKAIITVGAPPLGENLDCLNEMFLPEPSASLFQQEHPDAELVQMFCKKNNLDQDPLLLRGIKQTQPQFRVQFFQSIVENRFSNEVEILSRVESPTFLLNGSKDPFINSNYLKMVCAKNGNNHFKELINLHHYPFLEDPKYFSDIIQEIMGGSFL